MVMSEAVPLSANIGGAPTSSTVLDGLLTTMHHHNLGEDASTSSGTPSPSHHDIAQTFSDVDISRLFQSLSNPGSNSLPLSVILNKKLGESVKKEEKPYKPRNTRMKVYADGYFMTFDKESSCGTKNFWRCERKNECAARMHTEANSNTILKRIHEHSHPKPHLSELAIYNLPEHIDPDQVVPVPPISRSMYKSRRMSRAEAEIEEKSAIDVKPTPIAEVDLKHTVPPSDPTESLTNLSANQRKRKMKDDGSPDEVELMRVFEMAKQFAKLVNKLSRESEEEHPLDQTEIMIYVCLDSIEGDCDEKTYHPIELGTRSEKCLRRELEKFAKKTCVSNITMSITPKINVVINDTMVNSWKSSKFFTLDTSKMSWKLIPVENDANL